MSRKTRKTIEKMLQDPRAQEYMKTVSRPETPEEEIRLYEELAKKLDLDLKAEEIREYVQQAEQACRERTDQQAGQILELQEEDLAKVSGGKDNPSCMESYKDYENCWYSDGCDNIFQIYDQYICHRGFFTDHCHETAVPCDHDYYYQN